MKIILLSHDRALGQSIEAAAGSRASLVLAAPTDPLTLDGPAIIVIDGQSIPADRSPATMIATVAQAAYGCPIVLATDTLEAGQILQAVRAGADDIIPRSASEAELADLLARLLNAAAIDQGSGGRVTLLIGADAEAAALVATDMALTRAREGSPTLLLDCTMPTSAAQAYLDLPVSYGLASAIADIDRLDASLLSSTLARHAESGLLLLTFDGGTGTEPAGIAPAEVIGLVRLLRACCGDLILCAGSLRHGGLLHDLAALSDRIDLLCAQSIREMETARRLLDRIGPDHAARARLLLWDHQPGILLDRHRMTDVLGLGDSLPIPVDTIRLRNALNAGQPLAMNGDASPYTQAIRKACNLQPPARGAALLSFDRVKQAVQRRRDRAA